MHRCSHALAFGETDTTPAQHFLETVVPFTVVLTGAMFITDLGTVFRLIGSIGSCSYFLLFPTAMYLRSKAVARTPRATLAARCTFAFGVVLLVLGVTTTLIPVSTVRK